MTPEDIAYCTDLVKKSGTSFYYGMKILPAPRRDAMYAIYAFCRLMDDIADEDGLDFPAKQAALNDWRARIEALYRGEAQGPIPRALRSVIASYGVRAADFIAIIDGMEMDAGDPIIAPSLAELDLYCDRVASAVGRLSVRVFGDSSAAADEVAYGLGRGLQLTNILRDVAEDAQRGRLYLPREILQAHDVPLSPRLALVSSALPLACEQIAQLAEEHFGRARSAMAHCDSKAMRPARLMEASYRPLIAILRKQAFNYEHPRVSLPKWRKFLLAARILSF